MERFSKLDLQAARSTHRHHPEDPTISTTPWNLFRFYPSNDDRYTEAPTKLDAIARGLGLTVDELDAAMLTSDSFAEGYVIRAALDTRPEYSAAMA